MTALGRAPCVAMAIGRQGRLTRCSPIRITRPSSSFLRRVVRESGQRLTIATSRITKVLDSASCGETPNLRGRGQSCVGSRSFATRVAVAHENGRCR